MAAESFHELSVLVFYSYLAWTSTKRDDEMIQCTAEYGPLISQSFSPSTKPSENILTNGRYR
jgi:hypothetical protein